MANSFFTSGMLFSLGLFLPEVYRDTGWSYTAIALVFSTLNLLAGLVQPVAGLMADRWGAPRVLRTGVGCLGLGLVLASRAGEWWQWFAALGLLGGLGQGCTGPAVHGALISRWFQRRRGTVLGIHSACMTLGQLTLVSASTAVVVVAGWRTAMLGLGLGMLLVPLPLLLLFARPGPEAMGLLPDGEARPQQPLPPLAAVPPPPVGQVLRSREFQLMAASLFCCGFFMSMIFTHLAGYARQVGAGAVGAGTALSLMGAVGMAGSVLTGWLGDRRGRARVLAAIFLARSALMVQLLLGYSQLNLYIFAVGFGLLGYGTVPLVTSLTGEHFGRLAVGRVFGLIFMVHQLGGALGAYLGGLSVDRTGDLRLALAAAALLSLAAAAVSVRLHRLRSAPLVHTVAD